MDEENKPANINDVQPPTNQPGEVHMPESAPPEGDVFVDNPAAQPGMPAEFQNALNEERGKGPKKSKKKWILIVLLLLAAGAVGAYFLLGNKEEAAPVTNNDEPAPVVSATNLYYQTNTQFKKYEIKDSLTVDVVKIPESSDPVVLHTSNDGSEIIYATFESDATDKPALMSVYKATAAEETLLLKTKTYTYSTIASPVLSQDQKSIAYYAFENANATNYQAEAKIYMAMLDEKNTETALVSGTDGTNHGPLRPAVWSADGKSIYAQAASCYECDGPYTSNVWKIDTTAKTAKKIFTQPVNTTSGEVLASPDGKLLAVSAHNSNALGPVTFADKKTETYDVYTVDLSNDSSKKVYSEKVGTDTEVESGQILAGWSQDSTFVILGVNVTNNKASGDQDYTSTFNRFDGIAISNGKVTPFPVTMKALDNSWDIQATAYENTVFFTSMTSSADGSTTTYSLHSLPIGEGEQEVKNIETNLPKLRIVGSTYTASDDASTEE